METLRRPDSSSVAQEILDLLFVEARTYSFFDDREVPDELLIQAYELAKFAQTAHNGCPMRVVFVRTRDAKARLLETLFPGNVAKSESEPVTAIIAYDMAYYEHFSTLEPHIDAPSSIQSTDERSIETVALRNSSFQAAFLILALRTTGLDCGPMSGFSRSEVNEEFFSQSTWRANFLINIGYGNDKGIHERAPRLDFDTACKII